MTNSGSSQWMPTTGGVLNIVAGVLGIFGSLVCGIMAIMFQVGQSIFYIDEPEAVSFAIAILWISFVSTLFPSIISIVGGVFAIKRKRWGWALAGSICALFCFTIAGVLSLIFIIMGRQEFSGQGDNTHIENST